MKSVQISEDKKIMMNEKQSQRCQVNKILWKNRGKIHIAMDFLLGNFIFSWLILSINYI